MCSIHIKDKSSCLINLYFWVTVWLKSYHTSSPEPDAEAEKEDDDDCGEDSVGNAADAGEDLDAEQMEPAAVEQPVIHRVALEIFNDSGCLMQYLFELMCVYVNWSLMCSCE